MSKLNIMDLFNQAKQMPAPSMSQESVARTLTATKVELNKVTPLIDSSAIKIVNETSLEAPEFVSELSVIALLGEATFSPHGRLVAAGGPNLFLARGEALWVLDMTTGNSNDRSVPINKRPITDMEFNSSSSILVFTDGTDIGILKYAGINGSFVQLNPLAYLRDVGSADDPVVSVKWHPVMTQSFVSVREAQGWTLWDLLRLQAKSSPIDGANSGLFRSEVQQPLTVTEGTFKWTQSNDILAGKKLSPGVLAILKRGTDLSPERKSCEEEKFNSFAFSSDGTLAVASVGSALKLWSIGNRCSTIAQIESFKDLGGVAKSLVGIEGTRVACLTDSGIVELDLSESNRSTIRRTDILNFDSTCLTKFAFYSSQSVRENVIVVAGCSAGESVMVLLSSGSVVAVSINSEVVSDIRSLAITPTILNPRQLAVYLNGSIGEQSVWAAQTIDMELMETDADSQVASPRRHHFQSDLVETSNMRGADDDSSASSRSEKGSVDTDSSDEPPERLQSSIEFANHNMEAVHASIRKGADEVLADLSRKVQRTIETEVSRAFQDRVSRYERDCQTQFRKEALKLEEKVTESIRKVVSNQFQEGMKRTLSELGHQIELKVEKRMNLFLEATRRESAANRDLMKKLELVINTMEKEIQNLRSRPAAEVDPTAAVMSEIRRWMNAGDLIQAISTAAHWWKTNEHSNHPDLLAITCAAIAPQLRPGEPLGDVATACYVVLALTEWTSVNSNTPHADRTVAVLKSAKYVLSCLSMSNLNVGGEAQDLCYKSLNKSLGNAAVILGAADRTVEEISRDVLSDIRELMMRFYVTSRESTPRASSIAPSQPGQNILHLLQSGRR